MGHITQVKEMLEKEKYDHEELFVYCHSCSKGGRGYTIICDKVLDDEWPDICSWCGSRTEVKPLWE